MADKTARKAGLIYVSDSEPGYRRLRRGSRFDYVDRRGRRITDARELARILQRRKCILQMGSELARAFDGNTSPPCSPLGPHHGVRWQPLWWRGEE